MIRSRFLGSMIGNTIRSRCTTPGRITSRIRPNIATATATATAEARVGRRRTTTHHGSFIRWSSSRRSYYTTHSVASAVALGNATGSKTLSNINNGNNNITNTNTSQGRKRRRRRRSFSSSFASSLFGLFQTTETSNPILNDLHPCNNSNDDHGNDDHGDESIEVNCNTIHRIHFQKYQPIHFSQAAQKLQSYYEEQLIQLEEQIIANYSNNSSNNNNNNNNNVLDKLEEITYPIYTFKNILVLYSCMYNSNNNNSNVEYDHVLSEAFGIIHLKKYESSSIIMDALRDEYEHLFILLQQNDDGDDGNQHPQHKERLRSIQTLLHHQRIHKVHHQKDGSDSISSSSSSSSSSSLHPNHQETKKEEDILTKLNQQITQLEIDFITQSSYTVEQHGFITPVQNIIPYLYKIISLKQYRANLLGYDDYLSYCLDFHSCMAQTKDEIQLLHDSIVESGGGDTTGGSGAGAGAVGKFSTSEILTKHYDLMNGGSIGGSMDSHSSLSSTSYKDYFEFNHVLNEMFGLCSTLFDITIEEEKDSSVINAWDRDVRLFHIYNSENNNSENNTQEGEKIASFYLDPFRRMNKERSEFMAPILYKSNKIQTKPLCVMSLNIRPPTWDDSPIQLELDDVVNLFHEFGHLLQCSLVDVEMGSFCGTHTMEEDASEVVSQFMENWVFEKWFLTKLANHCDNGETLSDDMILTIQKQHQSTKYHDLLHRLFISQLELEVNSTFDPHGEESIIGLQRKWAEMYIPHHIPPKGNIDPLIQIFQWNANGKCSVQYRYLWSEVMSADLFAAFQEIEFKDDDDNDAMKFLGKKFRTCFLEKGGSVDCIDSFISFRGRGVDNTALMKRYGLK